VSGGGVAYINALAALKTLKGANSDEQVGINIVRRALEEPVRQIAHNAGAEGSVIAEKVKALKKGMGYNAITGQMVDMISAGIVDPAKVVRSALQNAGSVAGMVLTTEVLVADKPEKNPPMPPMGGGDMMM